MQSKLTILCAALGASIIAALFLAVLGLGLETGPGGRSFHNVSTGMDPTLLAGEYFTLRPIARDGIARLEEGALVMHAYPPDPSKHFMKRIVGVPGDTLRMEKGWLFRNSRIVREPYAWHVDPAADPSFDDFQWQREYLAASIAPSSYRPSRDNWGPLLVPPHAYFVLGDNRDNSLDSRYWGFVPFDAVIGTPRRIYWSQDPETHAIRWNRIGHRLN